VMYWTVELVSPVGIYSSRMLANAATDSCTSLLAGRLTACCIL
jgi:hypothetical protein